MSIITILLHILLTDRFGFFNSMHLWLFLISSHGVPKTWLVEHVCDEPHLHKRRIGLEASTIRPMACSSTTEYQCRIKEI
jgi:hypothetical protein